MDNFGLEERTFAILELRSELKNSKQTNKSVVKHEFEVHAKINMKADVNKVQIKVSKLRFLKLTYN